MLISLAQDLQIQYLGDTFSEISVLVDFLMINFDEGKGRRPYLFCHAYPKYAGSGWVVES